MIKDIKDKKPNAALIEQVKRLLADVESGEVRSVCWVCSWDDNTTTHGWAVDDRSYKKQILTEMLLMQNQYMTNLQLEDDSSVLTKAFDRLFEL